MNGSKSSIKEIVERLNTARLDPNTQVVIAPPSTYLDYTVELVKTPQVEVCAQNAYTKGSGAFTGEISVEQIKDVGATWVLLGHSERRTLFHESDEFVAEKVKYALESGLNVILAIGETLEERKGGITDEVNQRQLAAVIKLVKDWSKIVIAYEPVWAIGTGLAATPEDAQETHKNIRAYLKQELGEEVAEATRILYGGSANGKNAPTFKDKADVDGFLVGGASLKPEFVDIINSRE